MNRYREQLERAVRAAAVTSPTSYAWFGRRSRPLPPAVVAAVPPGTAREYLVDGLERELYRSFYSQGRPIPARPHRVVTPRPDEAFADALSRANSGVGGWEPGWQVRAVEPGTVRVARHSLTVSARVADCRAANGEWTAGSSVSVRRPKELRVSSPGFYVALGDADVGLEQDAIEVRVYFNLSAAGAAPLVGLCTRLLNDAWIPFSLKLIDHPTGYTRCDAAVLYLKDGHFEHVRGALRTMVSACAPHLRGEPPAFAKPLTTGVALGEHRPSLGGSFGSSRCRLVAEGIVAAHERRQGRLPDRVDAVARRFADHGLDIDVPYLAAGSSRRYAL
jgi:hypothetical protein